MRRPLFLQNGTSPEHMSHLCLSEKLPRWCHAVLTNVTKSLLPVAARALVNPQRTADAEKAAELTKLPPHSADHKTKPLDTVAPAVCLKSAEMFSSFYFVLENHIVRNYLVYLGFNKAVLLYFMLWKIMLKEEHTQ